MNVEKTPIFMMALLALVGLMAGRWQLAIRHAVRHSRAAPVEEDQSCERGQSLQESRERDLPPVLDVRDPAVHEDEVERTLAHDLVGEMNIAAPGVAGLGSMMLPVSLSGRSRHNGRGVLHCEDGRVPRAKALLADDPGARPIRSPGGNLRGPGFRLLDKRTPGARAAGMTDVFPALPSLRRPPSLAALDAALKRWRSPVCRRSTGWPCG
jgi:hypothetical protein